MRTVYELAPDALAEIVANVFRANGYNAIGIEMVDERRERVGFARCWVHIDIETPAIEVFTAPNKPMSRSDLEKMIYPNVAVEKLN